MFPVAPNWLSLLEILLRAFVIKALLLAAVSEYRYMYFDGTEYEVCYLWEEEKGEGFCQGF